MFKKLIFITIFLFFAFVVSAGQIEIARNDGDTTVKTDKHDKPVKIIKPEPKKQKEKPEKKKQEKPVEPLVKKDKKTFELTRDDFYWFFSTIAQTLGAIVGVIGMLTVFRFQNLTNSMQHHLDGTFKQRFQYFGSEKVYNQTPEVFINDFEDKFPDIDTTRKKLKDASSFSDMYNAYRQISSLSKTYKKIRNRFFFTFLIPQLIVIFFSIESLILSKNFADTITIWSFATWAIPTFLFLLLLSTIDMVRVLMKPKFDDDLSL